MSNPGDADATPITSLQQLADHIAAGCKPAEQFRIGTEHEKFGFRYADFATPPYQPADGQPGSIRDLLAGLGQFGGTPIVDHGQTIGLKQGDAAISLEPAGQLELSGAPLVTLHDTNAELQAHYEQVRSVSSALEIGFAPLGFHPTATRDQMPWMPKSRYAIMRRYMPKVGKLGLDMMTRTCTVQVNLDYASEQDMVRKLRVSLLLQPLATALFANSPFTEGRRYAQWLVDHVPMYFIYRNGEYIDVAGSSFRDFMSGRLHNATGTVATVGDFADHVTTVFTDVRVKRFLEMRGADAGRADMMVAQSAFWVGLLYDDAALTAAETVLRGASHADAVALRAAVPREGLAADWRGGSLRDLAREIVGIAADGLRARARRDAAGRDESVYLAPLEAIVAGEPIQAEHWLARFHQAWQGNAQRIFVEAAI
jgi:glutamate--cysteine ligase